MEYSPPIARPAYTNESGPVVRIDEAHHNYHTLGGRYAPFASLLRRDGYRLEASKAEFSATTLAGASIMVIANAEAAQSGKQAASAFAPNEIIALRQWVEQGGSLLLIADHPPFSDSAMALAQAFGFEFASGVALEAAMFTAQRGGPSNEPMGMNTPAAKQNYQFVLNLMHWLSGL